MIQFDLFNSYCALHCEDKNCKNCKVQNFVKWYNSKIPAERIFVVTSDEKTVPFQKNYKNTSGYSWIQ